MLFHVFLMLERFRYRIPSFSPVPVPASRAFLSAVLGDLPSFTILSIWPAAKWVCGAPDPCRSAGDLIREHRSSIDIGNIIRADDQLMAFEVVLGRSG
jgi:hypothetical protein